MEEETEQTQGFDIWPDQLRPNDNGVVYGNGKTRDGVIGFFFFLEVEKDQEFISAPLIFKCLFDIGEEFQAGLWRFRHRILARGQVQRTSGATHACR